MTAKDFWREFRLPVSGPLSEWHPPDMVYNYAEAYASHCTAQMREALEKISLHGLSGDPNHHRSYLVERLIAVRKIAAAALSVSGEPLRNHFGMSAERLAEIESVIEDSRYDIMPSVRKMLLELTKAVRSDSGEHAPDDDGWVKCSERMPNDSRIVDLYADGSVETGNFFGGKWTLERTGPQDDAIQFDAEQVEYWRERPSAPRKET